jgi:hypothetical protein
LLQGWPGYAGGQVDPVNNTTKQTNLYSLTLLYFTLFAQTGHIFYTSWRGFELVFHVAPELNREEQRQFLGNDKVVSFSSFVFVVFSSHSLALQVVLVLSSYNSPVAPAFRGNVNSVAVVLQVNKSKEEKLCDLLYLCLLCFMDYILVCVKNAYFSFLVVFVASLLVSKIPFACLVFFFFVQSMSLFLVLF